MYRSVFVYLYLLRLLFLFPVSCRMRDGRFTFPLSLLFTRLLGLAVVARFVEMFGGMEADVSGGYTDEGSLGWKKETHT